MRVTLDDDGELSFDGKHVGNIDVYTSIVNYEKLQAYIAAANEAFDAMKEFVLSMSEYRDDYTSNAFGMEFTCNSILQKVGD